MLSTPTSTVLSAPVLHRALAPCHRFSAARRYLAEASALLNDAETELIDAASRAALRRHAVRASRRARRTLLDVSR